MTCHLRRLHFSGLSLCEGSTDEAVATECPVLEAVQLEECEYATTISAASPPARSGSQETVHASMVRCRRGYGVDVLVRAAPLHCHCTLHIHGCGLVAPVTAEGEMLSLVTVSLTTDLAGCLGFFRPWLRYARSLNLSGLSTAALLDDDENPGGFPVFQNLRTLLLDGCDVGIEFQVLRRFRLPAFLQNAPSLEKLTMRDCTFLE